MTSKASKKRKKTKSNQPSSSGVKKAPRKKKTTTSDDLGTRFKYVDNFSGAPRMATWLITIILLGAIGGLSAWKLEKFNLAAGDEIDLDNVVKKLKALGDKALQRKKNNETLTVVIGTSLVQAAFFPDKSSTKIAQKLGYPKMKFLRIQQSGPLIVHRLIPLFDDILAAKPDAVLIENQLLLWLNQHKDEGFLAEHRKYLLSTMRQLLGSGNESSIFADPHRDSQIEWKDHIDHFRNWNTKKKQARLQQLQSREELFNFQMRQNQWSTCPSDVPPPMDRFFKKAKDANIPVTLLNITTSAEARSVSSSKYKECQRHLSTQYQQNYNVDLWFSPGDMGLDHFMDFCHFNRKGRVKFTKWMLPKLHKMIEGGESL